MTQRSDVARLASENELLRAELDRTRGRLADAERAAEAAYIAATRALAGHLRATHRVKTEAVQEVAETILYALRGTHLNGDTT